MIQSAEEYWTNKHPKIVQVYKGRCIPNTKKPITVDIRHFLTNRDAICSYVLEHEIFNGEDISRAGYDLRMDTIREWVILGYWKKSCVYGPDGSFIDDMLNRKKVLVYTGDDVNHSVSEFWQYHYETLKTGKGDCEDGAILICDLGLCAGIPEWRLRFTAGWAKPSPTVQQGGHAYPTYCRETDNEFVARDWCYNADPKLKSADEVPIKHRSDYGEVWFSTTLTQSYGNREYEIRGRIQDVKAA